MFWYSDLPRKNLPRSYFHYNSVKKSKKFPIPKLKRKRIDTSFHCRPIIKHLGDFKKTISFQKSICLSMSKVYLGERFRKSLKWMKLKLILYKIFLYFIDRNLLKPVWNDGFSHIYWRNYYYLSSLKKILLLENFFFCTVIFKNQ